MWQAPSPMSGRTPASGMCTWTTSCSPSRAAPLRPRLSPAPAPVAAPAPAPAPVAAPAPAAQAAPTILGDCAMFPSTSIFNTRIDDTTRFPASANSSAWVNLVGAGTQFLGNWGNSSNPANTNDYWGLPINYRGRQHDELAGRLVPIREFGCLEHARYPDEERLRSGGGGGYAVDPRLHDSAGERAALPVPERAGAGRGRQLQRPGQLRRPSRSRDREGGVPPVGVVLRAQPERAVVRGLDGGMEPEFATRCGPTTGARPMRPACRSRRCSPRPPKHPRARSAMRCA